MQAQERAQASDLLDATREMLGSDVSTLIPQTGKGVIDQWLTKLKEGENTTGIVNSLEELKTQLEGTPGSKSLEDVLQRLAGQTRELSAQVEPESELAPRLDDIASALGRLSGQLSK